MSVFLDFNKAFDTVTVDHSILLKKLYRYDFRGHIHSWFISYLDGTHQLVDISGCCSEKLPITKDVSQDSILGPMIFIIYSNDFCKEFRYF